MIVDRDSIEKALLSYKDLRNRIQGIWYHIDHSNPYWKKMGSGPGCHPDALGDWTFKQDRNDIVIIDKHYYGATGQTLVHEDEHRFPVRCLYDNGYLEDYIKDLYHESERSIRVDNMKKEWEEYSKNAMKDDDIYIADEKQRLEDQKLEDFI